MNAQLKLNESGVYEARWTVHVGGKPRSMRKSLRTPLRDEAERALAALLRGEDPDRQKLTLGEALDAYFEQHLVPRRQEGNVSKAARESARSYFGKTLAETITPDMIEAYTAVRSRAVQPQTVKKELDFIQAALNFCVRKGLIKAAPFRLPKPTPAQPRDKWMTEDQEAAMLAALPAQSLDVQAFVRLALAYGVRCQALLDLSWDQVDFERGQIDFNKPGARITRKRRAKVPITKGLMPLLLARKAEGGLKVTKSTTEAHYKRFAASIGLAWVTPHILKHTAVTLALRAGVPIEDVSRLMATDISTLHKTYSHHGRDRLLAAAGRNER